MKVVYVAGKFTGDSAWAVEQNVRAAEVVGYEVAKLGAAPLIPHANTRFFFGTFTEEFWYAATEALLLKCDAVLTVEGWEASRGAVAEVAVAEERGIPVFHFVQALRGWLNGQPHEAACRCPECFEEMAEERRADDEGPGF